MDLILLLRLSYLGAAAAVLLIDFIPALRNRFLAYGPRTVDTALESAGRKQPAKAQADTAPFSVLLDRVADIKVPHSWFTSFYQFSVLASAYWAIVIFTPGSPPLRILADMTSPQSVTMTYKQVIVTCVLFLGHGSRRQYESFVFLKPSQSQMWFGHWVLGIGFYLATSMALWVEGIPALQRHTFSVAELAVSTPDLRSVVSITLFVLASAMQYSCHAYLATLKSSSKEGGGYQLPQHPAFARIVTPHYTAECALYLALAVFAAPQGAWYNWTLMCALVFVAVNLGVTANGTKAWYESKFGKKAVEGKWRMIPFIF